MFDLDRYKAAKHDSLFFTYTITDKTCKANLCHQTKQL